MRKQYKHKNTKVLSTRISTKDALKVEMICNKKRINVSKILKDALNAFIEKAA